MNRYSIATTGLLVISLLAGLVVGCETRIPASDVPLNSPVYPTSPVPTLPPLTGPFVYQVPTTALPWPHANGTYVNNRLVGPVSAQESSTLRIEVRRNYGASVQIYDKVTNQALINFMDMGRESGMSSYGGPISFSADAPSWKGVGYNPLQAGDDGMNPSPILFHGNVNGWIYTKAQCLSWAHRNARRLPFFYEQWVRLDGNKVHVNVRLTHERPDKTFYEPRAQEWPMMMINGARKVHFYNGSEPFTGDATTVTDGVEFRHGNGAVLPHQRTPFGLTEPWQAVQIGPGTGGEPRLIGLYTPGYYLAGYNVDAIAARESWEGGNTITYTSNLPLVHLDSDNTWLRSYTYVIGTEKEIRDYVYAQERFPKPDFIFNQFNGRSGWVIFDGGYDQKEPFTTDDWRVTLTGKPDDGSAGGPLNARYAKLLSPYGSWRAGDFNAIYIRMAYTGPPGTGPQATLQLHWLLNGQAPDGVNGEFPNQNRIRFPRGVRNPAEQTIPFNVINDGQFHTYKINFADQPMWTGIVQQFEIAHPSSPAFIPAGETLTLRYFGTRDPGE